MKVFDNEVNNNLHDLLNRAKAKIYELQEENKILKGEVAGVATDIKTITSLFMTDGNLNVTKIMGLVMGGKNTELEAIADKLQGIQKIANKYEQ